MRNVSNITSKQTYARQLKFQSYKFILLLFSLLFVYHLFLCLSLTKATTATDNECLLISQSSRLLQRCTSAAGKRHLDWRALTHRLRKRED
jgi:hypothetical protein